VSFRGGLPPPFPHTRHHSKPHPSSILRAVARRHGGGCHGNRHCPSPFHPRPTPRAVAREAGSGWCGIIHHPPPSLLLPVVIAAIPPVIHPTSSCSLGWGGWCVIRHVVLVLGSLVVVPVVPIGGGGVMQPIAPEPPCEQVLAGVGGRCWCLLSLVSLAPRVHTHKPPYEQLLIGMVVGAMSSPGPLSVGH